MDCDVAIVGAGLAGLVAACELTDRGRRVVILDQEGRQSLGGQAFWSLGGLFMVDTPEQRRLRIRDSHALALSDWMGSAGFDGPQDRWPRRWARAYVDFAAGEMRSWLHRLGLRWFPVVGWAERGGGFADGHGDSVPRFHVTWGTRPGVLAPFAARGLELEAAGRIRLAFRHRVTGIDREAGRVAGVTGDVLAESDAPRGAETSREVVGDFRVRAGAVVVTSGADAVGRSGACGRADDRRCGRRRRLCHQPGPDVALHRGHTQLEPDLAEPRHPNPARAAFDVVRCRGAAAAGALPAGVRHADHPWRDLPARPWPFWFVLTQAILEKEFAFSGSEQNADLRSARWARVLRARLGRGATPEVEAFKSKGEDFVVADTLEALVDGMNRIGTGRLDAADLRRQIEARDAQLDHRFAKDAQVIAMRGAWRYAGDRLVRMARPHRILDADRGPLIAVRLHVLTRKSLGGLETDLEGPVLDGAGEPVSGLYAAGEAAGFGGGGAHGYNALEGTFLGGCLFSGRVVGRAA